MKWLGLLLCAVVLAVVADDEEPTQKWEPQAREVDREWSYFAQLPCNGLDSVKARSNGEQHLLERRRQQCLDRYKAFYPGQHSGVTQ